MNFSLENCIVNNRHFSVKQVQELLQYPHLLTYVLLDLRLLEQETSKLEEAGTMASNLSREELDQLSKFTLAKRKREWLGGRFAAKYTAARLLDQVKYQKNIPHWSSYSIASDENGRPFLSTSKEGKTQPCDISISHSASMAATMAAHKGYCGIDIQKVTPKIFKVRDRFCANSERQILEAFFPGGPEKQAAPLTKLWAAKEALRKASSLSSLPGFLELELIEIRPDPLQKESGPWAFIFNHQTPVEHTSKKCTVAVTHLEEDYALALTARNDTVG